MVPGGRVTGDARFGVEARADVAARREPGHGTATATAGTMSNSSNQEEEEVEVIPDLAGDDDSTTGAPPCTGAAPGGGH